MPTARRVNIRKTIITRRHSATTTHPLPAPLPPRQQAYITTLPPEITHSCQMAPYLLPRPLRPAEVVSIADSVTFNFHLP